MNDVTDIYNEAANKWSDNKGVGSVILSEPLSVMNFVTMVLDKMVAKTPELTSLIITETMEDRANITYYLDNTSELKDIHKQLNYLLPMLLIVLLIMLYLCISMRLKYMKLIMLI